MVLPKLLGSSERMDNDVFGSKGETYKHRLLMRELVKASSITSESNLSKCGDTNGSQRARLYIGSCSIDMAH
jgi:hypothetical protein